MFNGTCLPCVYSDSADTGLALERHDGYGGSISGLMGDMDAIE